MINAKVKIFKEEYPHLLQNSINEFLQTIDIRQVIKTDFNISGGPTYTMNYSTIIYYVELEDIRDAKIESILDKKTL